MSGPAGLYERVLGADWMRLPAPLREVHTVVQPCQYVGEASVETGRNPLARLLRWLMGFPAAAASVPVGVSIEPIAGGERWTRRFGARTFRSELSQPTDAAPGEIFERFGPMRFRIRMPVDARGLQMPVQSGTWLGLPLPRALLPRSDTREFVDDQGRFAFDVAISLPGVGLVVRYRGWLRPGA